MISRIFKRARARLGRFRTLVNSDRELAQTNPHVLEALEQEKLGGHRTAVIARTITLSIVIIILPFLFWNPGVLLYQAIILGFIAIGWLQLRYAQVGQSSVEFRLILLDLLLLTLVCTIPNPFLAEEVPNAYLYRFDTFEYFFLFLALATLAYSWRTVWSIGVITALLWGIGVLLVAFFGRQTPELTAVIVNAFPNLPIMATELDPNSVRLPLRIQEMLVIVLVAAILALKGWRSNQLLLKQAAVATERANLSRYFPPTLVDTLASANHDVGSVRSQNVAVLFCDIVGFTQLAETDEPRAVMELLQDYHSLVETSIFENEGTLDKFLGDGVMATFGTPQPGLSDANNALNAARAICDGVDRLNSRRSNEGLVPISVSVGVHYGPTVLGDIGTERRMEFAVIGDTVNVASRIEASTRELGCRIAVSDDVVRKAREEREGKDDPANDFTARPGIALRGRSGSVDIWTQP